MRRKTYGIDQMLMYRIFGVEGGKLDPHEEERES